MNPGSAGRIDWNIVIFAGIVTVAALVVAGVIAILVLLGGALLRRGRGPLECIEEEDR